MLRKNSPHPIPTPETPLARRLEHVREVVADAPTLKDFHELLTRSGDWSVSYSAVRNYHFDRDAPVDYLLRILEVFPAVRPAWLLAEEGPPTKDEAEVEAVRSEGASRAHDVEQAVGEALREGFPPIARWVQSPAVSAAYDAWGGVIKWRMRDGDSVGDLVELARTVGEAFQAPLNALGLRPGDLSMWQLNAYATLVGQAIQAATVTPALLRVNPFLTAQEETDG